MQTFQYPSYWNVSAGRIFLNLLDAVSTSTPFMSLEVLKHAETHDRGRANSERLESKYTVNLYTFSHLPFFILFSFCFLFNKSCIVIVVVRNLVSQHIIKFFELCKVFSAENESQFPIF